MSLKNVINFDDSGQGNVKHQSKKGWTILSVEDDISYQRSIELSLDGLEVDGQRVNTLTANSALDAAAILSSVDNISVILLDVVMQTDDAGLHLVDTIRNVIVDNNVRIILVTGQPGVNAPRQSLMRQYDIDDYWAKTDLTEEKLRSVVMSNIRTWHSLTELDKAKRGLQMIVDASRVITSKLDVEDFSKTVLQEVGRLAGVPNSGGVACLISPENTLLEESEVVASTGSFYAEGIYALKDILVHRDHPLSTSLAFELISEAQSQKKHMFAEGLSVLFFSTKDIDERHYIMLGESPEVLESQHIALMNVFCEHVKTGFANLALLNKLSQLAYYDSELGIPNRNWLERELTQTSEHVLTNMEIVVVSIANYSEATVMLGYQHTEAIVKALCKSIERYYTHAKAVCRIEFNQLAILFSKPNVPSIDELEAFTEQTICIDGIQHTVVSNVCKADLESVASYEARDLITIIEMALIAGRESGESVVTFSPSFTQDVANRHNVLQDLYQALTNEDSFQLALQPKVNMHTGKVVGAEALLRWKKASGEFVPPSMFIPIAEASGVMGKIDAIVMNKTFQIIQRLCDRGLEIPVSFNVTCSDVSSTKFIEKLVSLLSSTNIAPELIEVEITESQAMEDYEEVNPVLKRLLSLGVKVSVDDFGTGYSSLAHIADLAVSTLKVDRSFVSKLSDEGNEDAGLAVCEMVRNLARRFNFNIIAEGVENEEQKEKLLENKYVYAQGYLFAKPMMIDEFEQWCERVGVSAT